MMVRYWSVVSAVLLSIVCVWISATTGVAAEITPDLPGIPAVRPPRPGFQPQVGPSRRMRYRPVETVERSLAGVTGYGYGASPIGHGREVLANADEMDARSTVFDLSLVTVPDTVGFPEVAAGERWIRVDLGNQQVIAYEGTAPVRAFVVSTGLPNYPTVTGEFRIRMKVSEQTMSGDGYYLPGVKWVQYFYERGWYVVFDVPRTLGQFASF